MTDKPMKRYTEALKGDPQVVKSRILDDFEAEVRDTKSSADQPGREAVKGEVSAHVEEAEQLLADARSGKVPMSPQLEGDIKRALARATDKLEATENGRT